MIDCKFMDIPMVMNLKKIWDSDSDLIDPYLYRKLIGSLNYLVNTRPDICYVVNTLNQFLVEPRYVHWARSSDYKKNTSRYCFSLGSIMVLWSSRKHTSIATSMAKAEYIAASSACCDPVWF